MARDYDLIVVGSGVAGLTTALAAAPARVAVISAGAVASDGSSAWAQGGIAAAVGAGDSPAQHAQDTLTAGAGSNDPAAVATLTRGAAEAIQWLQAQGMAFDGGPGGLSLGREGGHGRHRILHAGGDATGARLMACLHEAVRHAPWIDLVPHTHAQGLALSGDRVTGVWLRDQAGERPLSAGAVVLASGGIGGLFRYTTNPPFAEGAGLALAARVGARLRDLEFIQFHPTALAPAGEAGQQLPLITEALRGAGALLRDGRGRRFLLGRHPMAELAPRDTVARAVWAVLQAGEQPVLDATHLGAGMERRFPTVVAACLARGIDPRVEPIPVVPAQHFHMGGIAVDGLGRTSMPGLYAVGEVACSGVHGSNRLASNSLLEGLVFGRRLGAHLSRQDHPNSKGGERWLLLPEADEDVSALRALMWQSMGLVRTGAGLRDALDTLANAPGWRSDLARRLLQAALERPFSLGAHFRSDGPLREAVG